MSDTMIPSVRLSRERDAARAVGKISETLDGREYQQVRAPPYLARLVQDIGHGRSGYPCSLRDITNR